jgi:hypothetical protein
MTNAREIKRGRKEGKERGKGKDSSVEGEKSKKNVSI